MKKGTDYPVKLNGLAEVIKSGLNDGVEICWLLRAGKSNGAAIEGGVGTDEKQSPPKLNQQDGRILHRLQYFRDSRVALWEQSDVESLLELLAAHAAELVGQHYFISMKFPVAVVCSALQTA